MKVVIEEIPKGWGWRVEFKYSAASGISDDFDTAINNVKWAINRIAGYVEGE